MRIFRRIDRMSRKRSERSWPNGAIGLEKEERKRRRGVFPGDPLDDVEDERKSDFANRKELGYVRAPVSRPEAKQKLLVDQAVGERHGLVNGDYVIVELPSKRVYANVVLHGTKGMHLLELTSLRERKNTWKFCFYQAVVALLAKTQLRYKHVRSGNIDYIYDHAWMLFTHTGTINVKTKQYLDDIVVFNFKYNVKIELVDEMTHVAAYNVGIFHEEYFLRRNLKLSREDPLQVRVELGCKKVMDSGHVPAHKDVGDFEKWLGKAIALQSYRGCILRSFRFSLAFWQDGFFWYLYNPYQCDEYGLWDKYGSACIVKFCSADSLRRHLMILLLRGHAWDETRSRFFNMSEASNDGMIYFDVQIFGVSFDYQLDNPKLLQRGVSKRPPRVADTPSDSLEIANREDETDREETEGSERRREPRERAAWLRRCRATTWSKSALTTRKRPDSAEVTAAAKARWHRYYVEEPNRLFSLWGEVHITDDMFDEANRGMQAYACYVVCAGMTRITAPEYWSPNILDTIVTCGDRYYTRSRHEADAGASRSCKYLSDRFEIGAILFETRMLPAVRGTLYAESSECLWRTLERVFSSYHFAALTCESACLGLFKFCGAYYMCDVNSFGPPLFRYGHGAAYLLRATSFRKFVTVLVLTIGSSERSRFSLNPIEILRIVEMDAALGFPAKTRERRHHLERFVGKTPGKLPRFAFGKRKKKRIKSRR